MTPTGQPSGPRKVRSVECAEWLCLHHMILARRPKSQKRMITEPGVSHADNPGFVLWFHLQTARPTRRGCKAYSWAPPNRAEPSPSDPKKDIYLRTSRSRGLSQMCIIANGNAGQKRNGSGGLICDESPHRGHAPAHGINFATSPDANPATPASPTIIHRAPLAWTDGAM